MHYSLYLVIIVLSTSTLSLTNGNKSDSLKIAAFNIQIFGRAKVSDSEAMDIIVQIIQRYDIVLVQEIRDSSGEAIQTLLEEVNKGSHAYEMTVSDRLGRTTSKEQYAFLYRTEDDLAVADTYQDPDHEDVFEREPYAVKFQSKTAAIGEFVLVAIHTSPDKAVEEINALKDVHDDIQEHWSTNDILILGDFNADCSYVSKTKMSDLVLNTPDYHWWIPDDADTTVSASDCAYDRFVMTGEEFIASVITDSAKVFYFDEVYGLTNEQAKAVSDHYPIEIGIQTTANDENDDEAHDSGIENEDESPDPGVENDDESPDPGVENDDESQDSGVENDDESHDSVVENNDESHGTDEENHDEPHDSADADKPKSFWERLFQVLIKTFKEKFEL